MEENFDIIDFPDLIDEELVFDVRLQFNEPVYVHQNGHVSHGGPGEEQGDFPPPRPPPVEIENAEISASAPNSPAHSVSLSLFSSPGGSPSKFGHPGQLEPMGLGVNWTIRSQSPHPPANEGEAKDFFAYRDSILSSVISEITSKVVDAVSDGEIKGTYLLTEIDTWNNEWERIVLLTERVLIVVKYDFIGMKIEDCRKLALGTFDKIIQGELVYPLNSLTPKINGIAEGIAGVVKESILPTVVGTVQSVGSVVLGKTRCGTASSSSLATSTSILERGVEAIEEEETKDRKKAAEKKKADEKAKEENKTRSFRGTIMSALSLEKFESKTRKSQGLQIIWNENQPISFRQKWNPFCATVPLLTLTSHPLFWHKGGGKSAGALFDIEPFATQLIHSLGQDDISPTVRLEYKNIVIESYIGITSLVHNANSLGFYKVRGKVSF